MFPVPRLHIIRPMAIPNLSHHCPPKPFICPHKPRICSVVDFSQPYIVRCLLPAILGLVCRFYRFLPTFSLLCPVSLPFSHVRTYVAIQTCRNFRRFKPLTYSVRAFVNMSERGTATRFSVFRFGFTYGKSTPLLRFSLHNYLLCKRFCAIKQPAPRSSFSPRASARKARRLSVSSRLH